MFSSFSFFAALPDLSMISLRVKNTGGTRLPDEPQLSETCNDPEALLEDVEFEG
jgi:hypothetical protein